MAYKIEN
ncbi:29fa3e68-c3c1-4ebe-ac79-8225bc2bd87c [Thermothielavioides terrestris]|nr:29fa3e68-c3c1-4ebe-ac79-8225bc2bd87c [Thermothielavioides terrestris]